MENKNNFNLEINENLYLTHQFNKKKDDLKNIINSNRYSNDFTKNKLDLSFFPSYKKSVNTLLKNKSKSKSKNKSQKLKLKNNFLFTKSQVKNTTLKSVKRQKWINSIKNINKNNSNIKFYKFNKLNYYQNNLIVSLKKKNNLDYFDKLRIIQFEQNYDLLKKYYIKRVRSMDSIKINYKNENILFLDLDETLIYCSDKIVNDNYFEIKMNNKIFYIHERPFLNEFLKKIKKYFSIIIFSASTEEYANKIISKIDPLDEIFNDKLFRNDCFKIKDNFFKDLSIIENIDLKNCLLVDNNLISYCNNLNNGIPIIPYFGNNTDIELKLLYEYLFCIKDSPDFRKENILNFKFSTYLIFNNLKDLKNNLINN